MQESRYGKIDENQVRELVGIPKTTQIYEVVKNIISCNSKGTINEVNNIINEGKDIDNFLWEIIKYIKDILVYKSSQNLDLYNEVEKKQIEELANKIEKERLLNLIYELSELANSIKWSAQKTIMFEAGMIKASMDIKPEKIVETINLSDIKKQNNAQIPTSIPKNINVASNVKPKINSNNKNTESLSYWNNVIDKIKQSGKMGIYVNLIGSTAKEINDMVIEVELANKNSFAKNVLESHENKAEIEKIASIEAGKTMSVRFVSEGTKSKSTPKSNQIENVIGDLDIPINIIDE